MSPYYFHLIEVDRIIEAVEPLTFSDGDAAIRDAKRQIRHMVSIELVETRTIDLNRSIRIDGPEGAAMVAFSDAITLRA